MEYNGGLPVISYLLQQTLRHLCTDSDWIYAVFWRILPRNYPPPKWDSESSFFDRSKGNKRNWILVWEDGFCDFVACAKSSAIAEPNSSNSSQNSCTSGYFDSYYLSEDSQYMQPELFFKMSHEVYNFGEGLIGKVAADNSHKWVYKEPLEGDVHEYPSSWAQGALDPYPRTWEAQFKSGIETIAIVAVKEGVIQLGSLKKTYEDLNFVLFLQRKFNYLQSVPGVFTVHPAVMHHAAISKKTSSIAASNWCPSENVDLVEDQRKTRHRRSAAAIGLSATSGDAADVEYYENLPNNRLPSAQEDSNGDHIFLSSAHHHQQISCQLDGSPSSPALHTSLHTLLSRLPSVSCRRS